MKILIKNKKKVMLSKLDIANAMIAELEKEIVRLNKIIAEFKEDKRNRPYMERDDDSPCSYHGTTLGELEDAENDINARVIHPFDSQDDIVVRIGDKVTTKYAQDWTIKAFNSDGTISFYETEKTLDSDRIAYKISRSK